VQADDAFAAALQTYFDDHAADSSPTARVVIQSDQECRFLMTAFDTAASYAQDVFASPALRASDLLDADALAATITAASDPVSAYLKPQVGSTAVVAALNAVVVGGTIYDASRFADVTLSAETQAALAAADDVPRLNRLLLQDAYPELIAEPAAKRVLRFVGTSVSGGEVAVAVPAGAAVSKATIATQEGVRSDRTPTDELAEAAGGRAGVHIGGDAATAAAITVDEAIAATGLAVPLLPLAAATQVTVELQGDFDGTPSGEPLARGSASLGAPGVATWATVFFDRVVLPAGPAWLVLRAAKGDAVWLAAPDGQLRVRRSGDAGAVTEVVLAVAPLFRLFARSGDALDLPATTLAVGGTTVVGTSDGDGTTYDITATLQAASAGDAVPVTITSTVAGTVTVYPPHVEYVL
jgi:hypothetical protein